jgi:hypothetical protein
VSMVRAHFNCSNKYWFDQTTNYARPILCFWHVIVRLFDVEIQMLTTRSRRSTNCLERGTATSLFLLPQRWRSRQTISSWVQGISSAPEYDATYQVQGCNVDRCMACIDCVLLRGHL